MGENNIKRIQDYSWIEKVTGSVLIFGIDGNLIAFNGKLKKSVEHHFKYDLSGEENIIKFINENIEDGKESILKAIDNCINGNSIEYEGDIQIRDGSTLQLYNKFSPNIVNEEVAEICWHIVNSTKNAILEADIDNSIMERNEILNILPLPFLIVNTEGEISFCNKSLLELLGSPSVEETKKINIKSFPNIVDYGIAEQFQKCVDQKIIVEFETSYLSMWHKGKEEEVHIRLIFKPLIEKDEIIDILMIVIDKTEEHNNHQEIIKNHEEIQKAKIEAEEMIKQLEYIQTQLINAKNLTEETLRAIAHDFRGPLNTLRLMIESILEELPLDHSMREYFLKVKDATKKITITFKEVLDYNKIKNRTGEIPFEEVDIRSIIEDIVSMSNSDISQNESSQKILINHDFEYQNKISVNNKLIKISIDKLVTIFSDRIGIKQIFLNLFSNALKFAEIFVNIKVIHKDNWLNICIKNDGKGFDDISENGVDFCEYFRKNRKISYEGYGIGTRTICEILESLGGKGDILSEGIDKGATINISIPINNQNK